MIFSWRSTTRRNGPKGNFERRQRKRAAGTAASLALIRMPLRRDRGGLARGTIAREAEPGEAREHHGPGRRFRDDSDACHRLADVDRAIHKIRPKREIIEIDRDGVRGNARGLGRVGDLLVQDDSQAGFTEDRIVGKEFPRSERVSGDRKVRPVIVVEPVAEGVEVPFTEDVELIVVALTLKSAPPRGAKEKLSAVDVAVPVSVGGKGELAVSVTGTRR